MAFGMGTRTCLGKNISLLEMVKSVPEVLPRLDFELIDPNVELLNRWFAKQHDFHVRVNWRPAGIYRIQSNNVENGMTKLNINGAQRSSRQQSGPQPEETGR